MGTDLLSLRLKRYEQDPFNIDKYLISKFVAEQSTLSFQPGRFRTYINGPVDINKRINECLVCAWNCHITSSYHDIVQFMYENDSIQLLALCETYLGRDSLLSFYSFPGYCLESKNRSKMGRGGLAFLVRDSLQYKVRDDFEVWIEGEFESFSVEVRFEENNFLFCIIYRQPSAMFVVLYLVLMI